MQISLVPNPVGMQTVSYFEMSIVQGMGASEPGTYPIPLQLLSAGSLQALVSTGAAVCSPGTAFHSSVALLFLGERPSAPNGHKALVVSPAAF